MTSAPHLLSLVPPFPEFVSRLKHFKLRSRAARSPTCPGLSAPAGAPDGVGYEGATVIEPTRGFRPGLRRAFSAPNHTLPGILSCAREPVGSCREKRLGSRRSANLSDQPPVKGLSPGNCRGPARRAQGPWPAWWRMLGGGGSLGVVSPGCGLVPHVCDGFGNWMLTPDAGRLAPQLPGDAHAIS